MDGNFGHINHTQSEHQDIADFLDEVEEFLATSAQAKETEHQVDSLFAQSQALLDDTCSSPAPRSVVRLHDLRTPRLLDRLKQVYPPALN